MKTVNVSAAVIAKEGKILATQRGYGEFEGGWEFPGGKIEADETAEEAIVREIKEELDADIAVEKLLYTVEYDYPTFHLHMPCFLCTLKNDHIVLLEHHAARWLDAEHIDEVDWLPADLGIIQALKDSGIAK